MMIGQKIKEIFTNPEKSPKTVYFSYKNFLHVQSYRTTRKTVEKISDFKNSPTTI